MRELPGGPVLRLYTFTVQVSSLVITGQGTKIPHATHTHTRESFQSQGNPLSTNINSLTATNLRAIIHTASRWRMEKKKTLLLLSRSVCPTLCNPMDCSTPGFPVLHHLLEFVQALVHCIDAIPPSHPLSPPGGSDGKGSACNAGDLGWIPGPDPCARIIPWRR